jgi:addiction module RelB/DinJ family antitoxin
MTIVRKGAKISSISGDALKLQVRMERSLKEEVEEVFVAMGLDTTTAVWIFFTKVARTRSIPFWLSAEPE